MQRLGPLLGFPPPFGGTRSALATAPRCHRSGPKPWKMCLSLQDSHPPVFFFSFFFQFPALFPAVGGLLKLVTGAPSRGLRTCEGAPPVRVRRSRATATARPRARGPSAAQRGAPAFASGCGRPSRRAPRRPWLAPALQQQQLPAALAPCGGLFPTPARVTRPRGARREPWCGRGPSRARGSSNVSLTYPDSSANPGAFVRVAPPLGRADFGAVIESGNPFSPTNTPRHGGSGRSWVSVLCCSP